MNCATIMHAIEARQRKVLCVFTVVAGQRKGNVAEVRYVRPKHNLLGRNGIRYGLSQESCGELL